MGQKEQLGLKAVAGVPVACPEGIEPPTHSLEGCCSIQLSYGQIERKKARKAFDGYLMVGAIGFEPTTLWSQTRCATRLRYTPNP